ncbi:MAG: adenosylcobinamide-GDP ribazoletransferase [Candidatus Omnitrophica bacterium]|nr:adenosylcobinamide-GDP ribazoletransferase [Candidatus Omnitrophota bacterium]
MVSLWIALQFLTIIPIRVKQVDDQKISNSIIFFPVIGLFLGLVLVGAIFLFSWLHLGEMPVSIFLVVLLVALSGGIHLDGLADTTDALLSHKDKDEMLRIMRDSHIGVMGVLSLICILLLKIALIYSMSFSIRMVSILLMCMLSRWAMVLAMYFFPYARQEGKARAFIQGTSLKILLFATVGTLVLAIVIWQLKGLLLMAAITLITYLIGKFIQKKINGITGDTIGAINELTEVLVLFIILAIERIWV